MERAADTSVDELRAQVVLLQRELASTQRTLQEVEGRNHDSERYRALFYATRDGQLLVDDGGIYVEVNEAYAALLKTTVDRVVGHHYSEFIPPDRLAEADASFRELVSGGSGLREFPLRAVDGTAVDCEWSLRPHFLPGLTLCSARDISERRRVEEGLRISEARFRAAVSACSSMLWTNNARGEMESVQPGWSEFTGQTREQYVGYGWSHALHPEDAQPTIEEWRRAVDERRLFAFEHRVRRKDGVYRLFAVRAVPVLNGAGEIREWVGVHTDITDERGLTKALRDSEERLRLAQAAAGIGIWDWDLDADRLSWSAENFHLMGLDGGVTPSVEEFRRLVHPEDRHRAFADIQRATQQGSSLETEFRLLGVDGAVRWVLTRARVMRNVSGRATRMLGISIDVTERKQAERRTAFLVRLDDKTRTLADPHAITQAAATMLGEQLEASRCIYADVDADGFGFYVSGDYTHGVPSMVGRHDFRQFNAEGWQRLRTGETHILANVRSVPVFSEVLGTYRAHDIVSVVGVPLHKEGRLVAFMAVHQNVARQWQRDEVELIEQVANRCWDSIERARAEAEVRRQSHTFDAVLSNIPDLICTFDLTGRFTYANAALLQVWGKSLPEIVGRNTLDLGYPPELGSRIQSEVQQVIDSSQSVQNYTAFTGADGHSRALEYIFSPVLSAAGTLEAVTCTARDISRRLEMEKELADSKQRLQQIFSQAPVAIVVFRGQDMKIELANPSYQAFMPGRPLLGQTLHSAIPELGADVVQALNGVLETGEAFTASEWSVPYDANLDGQLEDHWFNVVYHPLREAGGEVSGVVAVCSEVTVQVVARRALEQANRELEEFAFVASHDLQEPLRMVGVYTQLLLARFLSEDPKAVQYTTFIREGVSRMERLIHDLLSYSRVVHSEAATTGEADLEEALGRATRNLESRIQEVGAIVTVGKLPTVRGDTAQMALVFQNLLSNALKYRRENGATVIDISTAKDGDHWVISIRDNGIGFQQQYAERIFGLFKRLHKDEYSGTGLGLAICQRIVERFGGRIWAEGRVGQGATFYFALPESGAREN